MSQAVSINQELFCEIDGSPALFGAECADCGNVVFPPRKSCSRCGSVEISVVQLSSTGTLWTWTLQNFSLHSHYIGKKGPDFEPFYLGFVELPEGIKIESVLLLEKGQEPNIGMNLQLAAFSIGTNADGHDIRCYGFRAA